MLDDSPITDEALQAQATKGMSLLHEPLKVGSKIATGVQKDALPVGSKTKYTDGTVYTKESDGKWHKPGDADGVESKFTPTGEFHETVEHIAAEPLQKYSPDQPRDDHGRWGEGSAISGLPKEATITDRSLNAMLARDAFSFTATKLPASKWSSQDRYNVRVDAKQVPGIETWSRDGTGRRGGLYDPKLAQIATYDKGTEDEYRNVVPRAGLSEDLPISGATPNTMYRGMSAEEYDAFRQTGEIKTLGSQNIGDAQIGLTYWSTSPQQAKSYADGFAPEQFKPTFTKPAYVVAARMAGDHDIRRVPGVGKEELGVARAVKADEVTAVYRGRVYQTRTGDHDLRDEDGTLRPGSSSAYNPSTVWDQIELEHARKRDRDRDIER